MDEFWDKKMSRANDEFLFGASTDYLGRDHVRPDGISEGHGYVVMDARKLKSGDRLVKLRDPRGKVGEGAWKGPWSDGSKEWTIQAYKELGNTFGSDSVFWMSYEDFIKTFTHLDCMRHSVASTGDAVSSGLQSTYHGRQNGTTSVPGDNTHSIYIFSFTKRIAPMLRTALRDPMATAMDRSVSVDLAELPAGNYVVHLKVTGERDVNACSVEEVVEHECRNRVENKKFAQVGHSYDLAHSKARSYMDERIKLCQEKASERRQKRRRLDRELRRTRGRAFKKQKDKKMEKKQKRREAWEAEQTRLDKEYNAKVKVERAELKKRLAKAEAKVSEAMEEADGESEGEAFNGAETKSGANNNVLDSIEDSRDSENPKAETAGAVSISPGSPHLTPKSVESVDGAARNKQEVRPIDGATPALFEEEEPLPVRARPAYDSADESSDSPVEDWEVIDKANERVSKSHDNPYKQEAVQDDDDTEEEGVPDPWNAVCVVGIRVYSKDSGLELHTMMEGDEFLERHEACHRT
ncbi:hypothetical protein FSOLCH5_014530 [Fusarium solani]